MRLVKSHGLGNDYLVLASGGPLTPELARALCDRHTGIGGDGILEPVRSDRADYGLRIWNPDGSEAEKSGNGLRIYARWLVDHLMADLEHTVEVPAGVVSCRVDPETGDVTVEMGQASFAPEDVPSTRPLLDAPVEVEGTALRLTAVGMGNPHCVAFFAPGTDLDALPWRAWGSALEAHPLFPNRTNVQFAAPVAPDRVEARIWERGAGETRASGSSACAVAAAAHRLGHCGRDVTVSMPGGELQVRLGEDGAVTLRGPVEEICEIQTRKRFV